MNGRILIGAALGIVGACGGSTVSHDDPRPSCDALGACNQAAGGGSSGTGPAGSAGVFGTSGAGSPGAIDSGRPDALCHSVSSELQLVEIDLFVLLDRSARMAEGDSGWTAVTSALETFVESPDAAGLGIGIGYFGLHPPGTTPIDPLSPGSCNPSDYTRPDVPVDVLPGAKQAILDSLVRHTPGGAAPIEPALFGAVQYAMQRRLNDPLRRTLVVLITGGEPHGCTGNDLTTVSQVAAAGAAASPQILSFVVDVGNVGTLDSVARAGGTESAHVALSSDDVVHALKEISGHSVRCRFGLLPGPVGVTFDYDRVNVYVEPAGGAETLVYHVERPADCRAETGGWYFDRSHGAGPTTFVLCPATCRGLPGASRVKISVGCPTLDAPP